MDTVQSLNVLQRAMSLDPVDDAAEKLGNFLKWSQVIDVYSLIWPRLYKIEWKKGLGIWEMIQSFFTRLGRYFPLRDISMESTEDLLEWASTTIPYELANPFDPEGKEEWGSLTARVFSEFCEPEGESWADLERAAKRKTAGPGAWIAGMGFREDQFKKRVEALRGGKGFMKAFELVRHETGFMLLDMTYEECGDFCDEWDVATVQEAIEIGKQMGRFLGQAMRVIRMYDAHPEKLADMVEKAARIWTECIEARKK